MTSRLDKAINYISPSWGASRASDKNKLAMITGGYDAASRTSAIFQELITQTLSPDASFDTWDRRKIAERSRYNVRNIPIAAAITQRTCDHAIGDKGLALHPQIDRLTLRKTEKEAAEIQSNISTHWKRFAENEDIDINRELNFGELTYLTLRSELEGGDCATLFLDKERGNDFNLTLQTLEGEYISNKNNTPNTKTLVDGIGKDSDGAPKSIWFSECHPGDRTSARSNKWVERQIYGSNTKRRVILHHKNIIRPNQTRGVPILGPVAGKILQLGKLSDAELMTALVTSMFAILASGKPEDTEFFKKAPGEKNPNKDASEKITIGNGSIIRMKEGTTFESFDPKRPNALFEPFFKAIVAEIGAALGIPRSLIMMSFDRSYSASRGEVLLAWLFFLSKRTHIAVNFCQPVYETWLDEAVFKGFVRAPGYFSSNAIRKAYQGSPYNQWTGPTRPAIDELKEIQAYTLAHDLGTQSLQEITAKTTGRHWPSVQEQINSENKKRADAGIERREVIETEKEKDDEDS